MAPSVCRGAPVIPKPTGLARDESPSWAVPRELDLVSIKDIAIQRSLKDGYSVIETSFYQKGSPYCSNRDYTFIFDQKDISLVTTPYQETGLARLINRFKISVINL
jgi:hypothetical protein